MMIADAQKQVARFVADHQLQAAEGVRLIDLTSELGELGKEWLKSSNYGLRPFSATPGWLEEMGDVLFSLICLANSTAVDLDAALAGVLAKYESRFARHAGIGSEVELSKVEERV